MHKEDSERRMSSEGKVSRSLEYGKYEMEGIEMCGTVCVNKREQV